MRRVSVLLFALVAAACTAGGVSSGDARRSAGSTVLPLPEETFPAVEVVNSVPSGDEDPLASVPFEDFGSSFDIETDPFFERQSRPRLAANPTEKWSVDVGRVTVPFVEAVGDVIVVKTITPDDDQAMVAFSRTDGTVVWEFDPDETIGLVSAVGDSVLVTLAQGEEVSAVLLDGTTGNEIPLPSDENFGRRGRSLGAFTTGTCNVRNYDPSSGELVGEFCTMGVGGPDTFIGRVDDSIIEIDPLDFQPVSDPIPIDKISEQRRVMVFGDTVVAYSLSALNFLDRSGEIVASLPNPGDLTLTPAGVGSDVLIVYDYDRAIGLDVRTLTPIWERPIFVAPFGVVDGEVVGTTRPQRSTSGESPTEVLSLDTGDTKCVMDAEVEFAQNGFYEPDGVAYDLDCVQRWAIDAGDAAEIHIIDSGVVTADPTGDDTTQIRYLA